jgi:hypothetical protein
MGSIVQSNVGSVLFFFLFFLPLIDPFLIDICGSNCRAGTCLSSSTCSACNSGFMGPNCETACQPGYGGTDCTVLRSLIIDQPSNYSLMHAFSHMRSAM